MGDMMSATEVLARLRIDADSEDFEGAQLGPVAVRKLLKHIAALESDRWRQLCRIHSTRADTLRRERDELAARLAKVEQAEPVAWVPMHPRFGALWAMTTATPSEERLPSHYPLSPLYASSAPTASACADSFSKAPTSRTPMRDGELLEIPMLGSNGLMAKEEFGTVVATEGSLPPSRPSRPVRSDPGACRCWSVTVASQIRASREIYAKMARVLSVADDDTVARVLRDDATVARVLSVADAGTVARVLRFADAGTVARVLSVADAGTVARVLSVAGTGTVEVFGLEVPVIPDLDERMAEVAARGQLDMSAWHCGTTHCRAGWAVIFGGEAGRKLEDAFGPGMAGQLIYEASTGRPAPNFFAGNEEAMSDITACAQAAKKN